MEPQDEPSRKRGQVRARILGSKTSLMVSKQYVSRIGIRSAIHISVAAALFAVLYRYWLIAPVLQYVSIRHWRLFAIAVAAACGGALRLLRFPVPALSCGAMAGLVLGGTWTMWKAPHDVAISMSYAFASHLEFFWREILIQTIAATLAGLCCAYFAKLTSAGRAPLVC